MNVTLGSFTGVGGMPIHTISHEIFEPYADIILVHGYAEHSARYEHVIRALLDAQFAVFALDHRGHGRSGGTLGLVDRWEHLVGDLETYVRSVRDVQKAEPRPLFMIGHSMGALAVIDFLARQSSEVDGAVMSGLALVPTVQVPGPVLALSSILSRLSPTLPVAPLESKYVSRDPQVVAAYDADPFVYHGKVMARTGNELLAAAGKVRARLDSVDQPVLFISGDADKLTSPEGTDLAFEAVSSSDKKRKHYAGLYHEVFNEPERETVLADTIAWLEKHLA